MRGNFKIYSNYTHFVPGAAELVILFVWFLVGVLFGNVVSLLLGFLLPGEKALEIAMVPAYVCMFIPPMIYASVKSRSKSIFSDSGIELDRNNVAPLGWFRIVSCLAVCTLALGMVAEALSSLLPPIPETLKTLLESMTTGNFWLNFLCVSIFAPFFEEWLCRGMVMRGLLGNGCKPVWAIIISAFVFALIHMNPWQAIPAFLLGCLFGLVYWKTGSLKLTMLMHFVNNTFALVCGHIDSLREVETWKDILGGAYGIVLAASAIIVSLTVLVIKRITPEAKW